VAVRTLKRALILLLTDEGYKDTEIAERVGVNVTTKKPALDLAPKGLPALPSAIF
jgi:DNA-directed RNA polymerase specialized sigma24 family protein